MAHPASLPDPVFARLLADPRVALRSPPAGISLADVRAAANAFLARARGPETISAADLHVDGRYGRVPVRLYSGTPDTALQPAIVFVHGGGFVLGSLESHDAMCRSLAQSSGTVVVALEYSLAPEHPFPRPLHDVTDVIGWVRRDGHLHGLDASSLALAGDSAGGQLALGAALEEIQTRRAIAHVGLLYPLLDPSAASESAKAYADGYMLTGDFVAYAWQSYAGNNPACRECPQFDLRLADWRGFAPTTIIAAQCDPLHDEAVHLATALRAAGVSAELHEFAGMIHGFAGLPHVTAKAGEALDLLGTRLGQALRIDKRTPLIAGEEE